MKQILIFCFVLLGSQVFAQSDTILAPYQRFQGLPPIQLLLGDSTTKYTKDNVPKKKRVLLMLFSPDCSHCQHTAEELVKRKGELKNIYIIMATLSSISEMNAFVEKYGLRQMNNVIIGKDIHYLIPPFYGIKSLPYLAFYNPKGKLIKTFEGSMPLQKIIDAFK